MRRSPLFRLFTATLTALFLTASVPALVGAARSSEIPAGTEIQDTGAPTTDSWVGVAGAAVCGGGAWLIRTNPALGMNPWVLSGTIAGCLLMVLDCYV